MRDLPWPQLQWAPALARRAAVLLGQAGRRSVRLAAKQAKNGNISLLDAATKAKAAELDKFAPKPPTRRASSKRSARAADSAEAHQPAQSAVQGWDARKRRRGVGTGPGPAVPAPKPVPELPGYWQVLPQEIFDDILQLCTPRQLAMLESSCAFFTRTQVIEKLAEMKMKDVPRAKGLMPNRKAMEKWTMLLHFITSQSAAAAQATAVAFGATHSASLLQERRNDGRMEHHHSLCTFGRGFSGELGHGDFEDHLAPQPLCLGYSKSLEQPGMEEEVTPAVVACGSHHTASISRRGQLFTWGMGNSGELGHGEAAFLETPVPKRSYLFQFPLVRIVSVACGGNHTLAITEHGALWSCGRNRRGQLGIGTVEDTTQLCRAKGQLEQFRIVSVSAGDQHSMALSSDGSLFTWGDGSFGQLGHAHIETLAHMAGLHASLITSPRRVESLNPVKLQAWDRVTAIAAGANHCMAVTVGGKLLGFGHNKYGQLGTGDQRNRWQPHDVGMAYTGESRTYFRAVQVACGTRHSLALVAYKGRLQPCSTGDNFFGQLGVDSIKARSTFGPIQGIKDPIALQAGVSNSGAVGSNGKLYLWGRGDYGQLGNGKAFSSKLPRVLPGFRAVHPDKTLRRNKRTQPRVRPVAELGEGAAALSKLQGAVAFAALYVAKGLACDVRVLSKATVAAGHAASSGSGAADVPGVAGSKEQDGV